ncbi:MAG: endonuclease/exonuclease/phosphatase family protein [Acidobacteriota bacterium]|nr:endonuclease/exonuclease/phosphatase family protein [Acidobacteriota bacterium]
MQQILRFFSTKTMVLTVALAALQLVGARPALAGSSVYLDAPKAYQTVDTNFHIGGWAVDWDSRHSSGVMTIHVWAYPEGGAPPIWVGVPSSGNRSDVAAAFGSNFLRCGFGLNVEGTLPPGNYLLAVFPFSEIRGAFDYGSAIGIPITVRSGGASSPAPAAVQPTPTPAPADVQPTPAPAAVEPAPAAVEPTPAPSASGDGTNIRVLEWNLHHGVGTDGVYDIGRIGNWIGAMSPDVVVLNEVEKNTYWGREDQPARYEEMLEGYTGREWYGFFAQEFGDWGSNGKGTLILSRFPIEQTWAQEISADRVVSAARIMVNGRGITVVATHLDPYDRDLRLSQAREVLNWSAGLPENRLLIGDMNAWPDQSSILEINKTYFDTWTLAVDQGAASGVAGISPFGATKNGRIDYIFMSKGSSGLAVVDSKVYDTRDGNGVAASDHRPVVTTLQVR